MRPHPVLVAITDTTSLSAPEVAHRLTRLAQRARPGAVALLLRDPGLPVRARHALGRALKDAAREHEQELWVADRLDLALLLDADALHLGEASVSARAARAYLPPRTRVSRAWHETVLSSAPLEELEEVDAVLISPVLAPRKGRPALGLPAFGTLVEALRDRKPDCAAYALGGVFAENAATCVTSGATGVAAIGAALAEDPEPLLAALGCLR